MTEDARFFSIEVIISSDDHALIELEAISDGTSTTSVSAHERGKGKSFGCLSLEVVRELLGKGLMTASNSRVLRSRLAKAVRLCSRFKRNICPQKGAP